MVGSRNFLDVINRSCQVFKIDECLEKYSNFSRENIEDTAVKSLAMNSRVCVDISKSRLDIFWQRQIDLIGQNHLNRYDNQKVSEWDPIKRKYLENKKHVNKEISLLKNKIPSNGYNEDFKNDIENSKNAMKLDFSLKHHNKLEQKFANILVQIQANKNAEDTQSSLETLKQEIEEMHNDVYMNKSNQMRSNFVTELLDSFINQLQLNMNEEISKVCNYTNSQHGAIDDDIETEITAEGQISDIFSDDL